MPSPLESAAEPLVVSHAPWRNRKHHALTEYPVEGRGSRFKNIAGKRFGKWLVMDHVRRYSRCKLMWHCRCDCGTERWVNPQNLRLGKTKSCGCGLPEATRLRMRTHRKSKSNEYKIWMAMRMRCLNKNANTWKNYGGRGIKVCDRWLNSFPDFLSDMGKRPSNKHSIERKDVNGNYDPSNCKWATDTEQARNNRRSEYYRFVDSLKSIGIINHYYRITSKGVDLIAKALNLKVPYCPPRT